jgi:hypothetical protein
VHPPTLRYDGSMRFANYCGLIGLKGLIAVGDSMQSRQNLRVFQVVGWASVVLGITALGLYFGRDLRARYKFNHRTQYDFFSHAGDQAPAADYGLGV